MSRRVIEYDPATRTTVWHDYDHESKTTVIEEVQDVSHYLRANKARYNHDTGGAGRLNDTSRRQIRENQWHVASIPIGVQSKWLHDFGVDIHNKDHWPAVKRLLNDPDWRYLRVNPGRI